MRNQSALPDNDPLQTTLDSLRSDVERTPLADSLSVRRRGDQRTRYQAVAGALVVAALVAGAFGVADLRGNERNRGMPANPSPSPSETPLSLAAQPLLLPDDIGTAAGFPVWQANPDPANANIQVHQCVPIPSTLGAQQSESRMYYDETEPAHVYEHVLRFADVSSATRAGQLLLNSLSSCTRGGPGVVSRGPELVSVAGADTAQRASRSAAPPGSEVSYYELAVVREGNVLIVLQCTSMVLQSGSDWAWFPQRLRSALDTAVSR